MAKRMGQSHKQLTELRDKWNTHTDIPPTHTPSGLIHEVGFVTFQTIILCSIYIRDKEKKVSSVHSEDRSLLELNTGVTQGSTGHKDVRGWGALQ